MAQNSIGLFFRGKLFADPKAVYARIAIGVAVTTILLVVLDKIGLPLWGSAFSAGLLGGVLQPFLFKDLRYR